MAGSIATAYVQVMPSMQGVKSNLEQQFGAEGSRSGSTFGSNLIKTALGAISVAKIGEALGKTLTEGAALEQNLGGVSAVFGEFASGITSVAEQMYSKMGVSASDYMATANQMGSLFQGSGIEQQRSLELTAQAMQRAADVASVMGIDTSMALESIAGAAKGNFTMMDNLGVAMNATTLQAYALEKGVNFKWETASNAEKAELAMQMFFDRTAQYAGNFEREASETLSGSFEAMKAAFSNVLGNLSLGRDLQPSLNALASTTGTFLKGNLVPAVLNVVKVLPGAAGTLLKAAMPGSMKGVVQSAISGFTGFLTEGLPEILSSGAEMVDQLCAGFSQGGPNLAAAGSEAVEQVLTCVIAAMPLLLDGGGQMLVSMATGFLTGAPGLLSAAGSLLEQLMVSLITEGLPQLLSGGSSLILSMAQGLISGVPGVVSSAVSIGAELLATIASYLPELLAQGISLIGSLVAGLISMVPDVVGGVLEIGQSMLNAFGEIDWLGVGISIIDGIYAGIMSMAQKLIDAMTGLGGKVVQAAKDALDINSPSRVFRDQVGKFIPAGVAVGIQDNMSRVTDALDELSATATMEATAALKIHTTGSSGTAKPAKAVRPIQIIQNIYSQAQTAADLMQEARYQAEMAVLLDA